MTLSTVITQEGHYIVTVNEQFVFKTKKKQEKFVRAYFEATLDTARGE